MMTAVFLWLRKFYREQGINERRLPETGFTLVDVRRRLVTW